nr:DUF5996 family protein [Planococcus sp. ISL-109]
MPYPFINRALDSAHLKPVEAYFDASLSEYFLKLESVAASENPSNAMQGFFRSTFDILSEELKWQGCAYYFTPLDMPKQKA